ncbi:MAG TPA: MOSC domain-containing protein, partial [Nocardioidaceae bacterium]|nr:MOSC domain-containing protein [Nocardioidaceae bacterium]
RDGQVSVGDAIEVVHRPDHGITVTTMFKALTTDRQLLPSLLDAGDDLTPQTRETAEAHAARA